MYNYIIVNRAYNSNFEYKLEISVTKLAVVHVLILIFLQFCWRFFFILNCIN